jgi:hypothetical protein
VQTCRDSTASSLSKAFGLVRNPQRRGGDTRQHFRNEPDFDGELWVEAVEFEQVPEMKRARVSACAATAPVASIAATAAPPGTPRSRVQCSPKRRESAE